MTPTFIIAEAGLNHGGVLGMAFELVDAAHIAGADAVKFQTFQVDKVLRRSDPDYDLIKSCCLSYEDTATLKRYCGEVGIEFMSTPGDVESLEFLEDLDVKHIKIGSDDLTNEPLMSKAKATQIPLIISTGMATMKEIWNAVGFLNHMTLLHCVSLYPCPPELANLKAIRTIGLLGFPVGYSDHTTDIAVPVMAVAAGATVIEKHIKLNDNCIDNVAAVRPERFAIMVQNIRAVEAMLGSGDKKPCAEELKARDQLRKNPHDWLRGVA